jgi:quercetin dioxygenase-like cupin family protein
MMLRISSILLWGMGLGAAPISAAQESYVPLSEESNHVPVLVNDAVRAVNVTLPPGESTLFHEHTADIVTITLEGADLINQNWQQQPTNVQRATGRVSNTPYGGGSHVHRVTNNGQSTFRIIAIEVFTPRPMTRRDYARRTGLNELALEDDRVRIWRVALEPGQGTTLPALPLPTVRVTQTSGRVVEAIGSGAGTEKTTRLGDVAWLERGTQITVHNTGNSLVVYYDVEIK